MGVNVIILKPAESRSSWTLVRPPDMHVGGLIFYQCFFFLSFFFFRQLPVELAERNSTIFGHMVGSKCSLKMHVGNLGYPIPLQSGGPKTTFWTILQPSGNFNSLYLPKETRYRQPVKCVDNSTRVCYIVSKRYKLWSTNGFKLEVSFHPPSVKSALPGFADGNQQTELNHTLTNCGW